jgi:recombination protein RecA
MAAKVKIKIENKTGIAELDSVLSAISNKFSIDLSGSDYGDIELFSSGSLGLDIALGGGFPVGRIVEIYGPEASFKTSLALVAMANRQRIRNKQDIKKYDLILDLEHALQTSFIKGFGIDMSQVIWERPGSAEQALQMAIDLPKSGYIDTVLFDSVDTARTEAEQSRDIGDSLVGGSAKAMSQAVRTITKIAPRYQTTYLFINQVRQKPGVSFGNPEVTPGGMALAYYAHLRLKMLTAQKISSITNAKTMRLKIAKTKIAKPYDLEVNAAFQYALGFNEVLDLMQVASDFNILRHSSGRSAVKWTSTGEEEYLMEEMPRGKDGCIQVLTKHKQLRERLRHACLRAAGVPGAKPDTELTLIKEQADESKTDK